VCYVLMYERRWKHAFDCHGELKQTLMPISNQFFNICIMQPEHVMEVIELYCLLVWQVSKSVVWLRDVTANYNLRITSYRKYVVTYIVCFASSGTDMLLWDIKYSKWLLRLWWNGKFVRENGRNFAEVSGLLSL
jgi:hypothetical protein